MGLTIKICGLSTAESLETALDAGADMIGLMRFERSPRHVALDRAADLAAQARGRAETVLVTVNMPNDELDAAVAAVRPDWIQFHGTETPEQVATTARRTGCGAIKALGVAEPADLDGVEAYVGAAELLLLDTKPPRDASRPGGHGVTFDWGIAAGRNMPLPYLLAGGLGPDNVAEAIRQSGAAGVDVSSGVESARGVKDNVLVSQFIAAAREAEAARDMESMAS